MAYVAISQDLTGSVANRIDALRNAELSALAPLEKFDEAVKADQTLRTTIIDQQWGPLNDLRDRLTPHDLNVDVTLELITNYTNERGAATAKRSISLGQMKLPCFTKLERSYYGARLEVKMNSNDHPALASMSEIMVARDECSTRWDKVKKQVLEFVKKCKSLNEAVKLWPDLRRYIDDEYLERLDKKVERARPEQSEAAAALKALDVEMVNSSVVLARMAGAQV